jgi:hypothetical protein
MVNGSPPSITLVLTARGGVALPYKDTQTLVSDTGFVPSPTIDVSARLVFKYKKWSEYVPLYLLFFTCFWGLVASLLRT